MSLLFREDLDKLLLSEEETALTVTPILDRESQLGECTIDLRLGTMFKVDLRTRQPVYDPMNGKRPIETFFEETYRNFGEKFILYPGQLTLASTFEYIKLPKNIFGIIYTRSSWNRLGINISSIIQPGYAGVLNLELMNNSSNPLALYSGLRIVQLVLYDAEGDSFNSYLEQSLSKYVANSEPNLSNIVLDHDLQLLKEKFPVD
ncbi:MAG: dCTP deaminase [Halanaerobiales bacterium]